MEYKYHGINAMPLDFANWAISLSGYLRHPDESWIRIPSVSKLHNSFSAAPMGWGLRNRPYACWLGIPLIRYPSMALSVGTSPCLTTTWPCTSEVRPKTHDSVNPSALFQ